MIFWHDTAVLHSSFRLSHRWRSSLWINISIDILPSRFISRFWSRSLRSIGRIFMQTSGEQENDPFRCFAKCNRRRTLSIDRTIERWSLVLLNQLPCIDMNKDRDDVRRIGHRWWMTTISENRDNELKVIHWSTSWTTRHWIIASMDSWINQGEAVFCSFYFYF